MKTAIIFQKTKNTYRIYEIDSFGLTPLGFDGLETNLASLQRFHKEGNLFREASASLSWKSAAPTGICKALKEEGLERILFVSMDNDGFPDEVNLEYLDA